MRGVVVFRVVNLSFASISGVALIDVRLAIQALGVPTLQAEFNYK